MRAKYTKLKRYILIMFMVFVLCAVPLLCASCSFSTSSVNLISSIMQTGYDSDTNQSIYTITYSNGSTSTFTITNGSDGEDVSIWDIFTYCVNTYHLYSDTSTSSFTQFLSDYLSSQGTAASATQTAILSAVGIYTIFPVKSYDDFIRQSYYSLEAYCGSGVIYQMDKTAGGYSYIITNYHVTFLEDSVMDDYQPSEIYIYQYGMDVSIDVSAISTNSIPSAVANGIEATYVGGSAEYDLAVLRVKTSDLADYSTEVQIADSYDLAESTVVVGNPLGYGISSTEGIVNVLSEYISYYIYSSTVTTVRVLRTDTAINGGNSGGGIFNLNGELIGIVNAKANDSSIDNMGYALPVDNVVKVVNNILANMDEEGETSTGVNLLQSGISVAVSGSYAVLNSDGTLTKYETCAISSISESSPFAGSLQAGDIITKVVIQQADGSYTSYDITSTYVFEECFLDARTGCSILIYYTRGSGSSAALVSNISAANFSIVG